jgi:hypothetical protein
MPHSENTIVHHGAVPNMPSSHLPKKNPSAIATGNWMPMIETSSHVRA